MLALTALAASLALVSVGGGLYKFLVVDPAWPRRLEIIQPERGGVSRRRFWIPAHVAFELLLIASLAPGPGRRRRFATGCMVAFASHALMRIWSAFDFIPKALAFERAEASGISEAAARSWTRRKPVDASRYDVVTCTAMLAALVAAARFVKVLRYDEATRRAPTILLKFEPGAIYPGHSHPGGEEIFVLEGEVRLGKDQLRKGDYLYTAPGNKHAVLSKGGCVLLVNVPEEVERLR